MPTKSSLLYHIDRMALVNRKPWLDLRPSCSKIWCFLVVPQILSYYASNFGHHGRDLHQIFKIRCYVISYDFDKQNLMMHVWAFLKLLFCYLSMDRWLACLMHIHDPSPYPYVLFTYCETLVAVSFHTEWAIKACPRSLHSFSHSLTHSLDCQSIVT